MPDEAWLRKICALGEQNVRLGTATRNAGNEADAANHHRLSRRLRDCHSLLPRACARYTVRVLWQDVSGYRASPPVANCSILVLHMAAALHGRAVSDPGQTAASGVIASRGLSADEKVMNDSKAELREVQALDSA